MMFLLLQKEARESRIREDKLCYEIQLLQSKLCKETLRNSVLKERLTQVSITISAGHTVGSSCIAVLKIPLGIAPQLLT